MIAFNTVFAIGLGGFMFGLIAMAFFVIDRLNKPGWVITYRPCGHRLTLRSVSERRAKEYAKSYMRANDFESFSMRRLK